MWNGHVMVIKKFEMPNLNELWLTNTILKFLSQYKFKYTLKSLSDSYETIICEYAK